MSNPGAPEPGLSHRVTGYEIRPAAVHEVGSLPEIEVAASEIFPHEDIAPEMRQHGLPRSFFERAAEEGHLWIAIESSSQRVVGFALVTLVDGSTHLYEMDVLPDHGGRGVGGALVETVAAWARGCGSPSLTLTTFRHLAWNAPFYRKHGFVDVDPSIGDRAPELTDLLLREAENGLNPETRVAMRRDL
jgi:GNAT superfamily N-acetyltransferase